uniref:Uncharacterized protein n=1 Tax=Ditylenchus dipsaci TaxID=166011 RepID=A0A915CRQ5_9BILA
MNNVLSASASGDHLIESIKYWTSMLNSVTAKRSLGAELATGAVEKPSASVVKLEKKLLERVDGQNSPPQMRKAASCHSIGALKKFFQRCTRKRFPPLKYLRDLKEEEFKSLHYTHRGAVVKPSDEGFQENFLIYATKLAEDKEEQSKQAQEDAEAKAILSAKQS